MKAVEFGGQLRTYHIDGSGHLVENVWNLTGGQGIDDKVLQSNRGDSEPAVYVFPDGSEWCLAVATMTSGGAGDKIHYYSGDGHWRDSSGAVISGI